MKLSEGIAIERESLVKNLFYLCFRAALKLSEGTAIIREGEFGQTANVYLWFRAALKLSEGIAIERESLVKSLCLSMF